MRCVTRGYQRARYWPQFAPRVCRISRQLLLWSPRQTDHSASSSIGKAWADPVLQTSDEVTPVIDLDPGSVREHTFLCASLSFQDLHDEEIAAGRRGADLAGPLPVMLMPLGSSLALPSMRRGSEWYARYQLVMRCNADLSTLHSMRHPVAMIDDKNCVVVCQHLGR